MSSDYKIMVVDDEHDILYMIVRYLKVSKFHAEGFTDPRKALESFESDPKGYSLVLTDVRMPGI